MEENKSGHDESAQVSAKAGSAEGVGEGPVSGHRGIPVAPSVTPAGNKKSGSRLWIWAVVAVVVLGLLIAGGCFYKASQNKSFNEDKNVSSSQYQALFLTNGQVYFGHISDLNNKYVTLTNIYYLQVQQNLQQGSGGNTNSQVSLAKLGSELHGPEDKMHVASDQVLFWENLKNDSKVVQAITKYQNQ